MALRAMVMAVVYIVKMLKKVIFGEVSGYRELGKKGDTAVPRSNCKRHADTQVEGKP
jgi:hypothetical protein